MATPTDGKLNQEFGSAIKDNRIPPCPVVLERISIEMHKDDPNFKQLAYLISSDVGLAAGLIKLANSPYFGARKRVSSVNEALLLLGLDTASQAVACIALGEAFPNLRAMDRFWDASAQIANISGWLAQTREWPGVRPQEAYTFGLFRDCGIAVLLQHFPDYTKVLKQANTERERAFTDIEDEVLPTNHAVMGALMTRSWWLPEIISMAVRHHHDLPPDFPAPTQEFNYLSAIAQTAEHILQAVTGRSLTCEWEKLGPTCLAQLGLSEEDLGAMEPEARHLIAQHAH